MDGNRNLKFKVNAGHWWKKYSNTTQKYKRNDISQRSQEVIIIQLPKLLLEPVFK